MSAGNDFHNRFNSEQAVDELNEPIIGILCDIDNDPLKCYYSEKAIKGETEMENTEKILVVIDMQNDFIDGSLGTAEAQKIVGNVVEKIKSYEPKNIYATRDTHYENYLETSEGVNLPVVHCVKDTDGWQIRGEIAEAMPEAKIVDKPTFGSTDLADMLFARNEREHIEIELVGLCTDICVVSNALLLKAKMPEVKISVDSSCCAGVTPDSHKAALETMKMCQINIK